MGQGVARRLLPIGDAGADEEQHHHHCQDRPALTGVAHGLAEAPGEADADHEDRQHLDEVDDRGGVLERMRGVGVEEAATVGAEHLDRLLRGDGTEHERLLGALQRVDIERRGQRLRHPAGDQHQRVDHADRQQQVERDPREIGPEVAQRARLTPGEATEEGEGHGDTGGRREEVVRHQRQHLRQVRERALTRIGLPVGVGGKRDRGVHREIARQIGQRARVQRQHALKAQQQIGRHHRRDLKREHVDGIGAPRLLFVGVDPGDAIEAALDRAKHGVKGGATPLVKGEKPHPHRFRERDDEEGEGEDQSPAGDGHGRNSGDAGQKFSGRTSTATR